MSNVIHFPPREPSDPAEPDWDALVAMLDQSAEYLFKLDDAASYQAVMALHLARDVLHLMLQDTPEDRKQAALPELVLYYIRALVSITHPVDDTPPKIRTTLEQIREPLSRCFAMHGGV